MGPSLIGSCLTLAIRTAKSTGGTASDRDLEVEIERAIRVAGRVFTTLVSRRQNISPQKQEPWFVTNADDAPK
jgi:hypothetical protein